MALNLVELIKASGGAGTSGQSFRSNVSPATGDSAMDNFAVSHYRITAVSFTGEPVDDAGNYSDNTVFNIVATFTRGAEAYRIQRNVVAAWSISCSTGNGATAAMEAFAAAGSPTGATHSFNLRVRSALSGTAGVSPLGTSDTSPGPSNPHPVDYDATPTTGGASGTTLLTFPWSYDPDTATFNPAVTGASWTGYFNNRGYSSSDYDFDWRTASGGGGISLSTSQFFTPSTPDTSHYVYPTSETGLLPGEYANTLYLRWRVPNGSWTDEAYTYQDPRPPE